MNSDLEIDFVFQRQTIPAVLSNVIRGKTKITKGPITLPDAQVEAAAEKNPLIMQEAIKNSFSTAPESTRDFDPEGKQEKAEPGPSSEKAQPKKKKKLIAVTTDWTLKVLKPTRLTIYLKDLRVSQSMLDPYSDYGVVCSCLFIDQSFFWFGK